MTQTQQKRLTLFTANTQEIKGGFVWQSAMMKHMAALLYTAEDKAVDEGAIRYSYDMIKENTGVFSMFRGNSALSIAALLSLTKDREKRLADTLAVYDCLKQARFHASDYLVGAAYQIASGTVPERYSIVISRMRSFYDGMKELHPFLTSSDDYIFSAMLGLSDVDVSVGVARMERLYRALKPEFLSGNGVQALTQVLVLGNKTDDVIDRVLAFRQELRADGMKLDRSYTLSSLGVLVLLPGTVDEIVRGVREVFEYLRGQKGFGAWSFPRQELELYASALAAYERMDSMKNGLLTAALSTSITNIIIAQQAAVAAAVSASAAASASS